MAKAESVQLTLSEAIAIAEKNSPLLSISRFEVEEAERDIDEVFGVFSSPKFEAISYGGLVSDAKGDIIYSPDDNNDYSSLGPFFKIDLKIIQPLYTFGKYDAAMEAAKENVKYKEASYKETLNNLAFEVTKAFLGAIAGRQGAAVGKELSLQYERLLSRLDAMLKDQDSEVEASYVLEAKSMFFEIKHQASQPVIDEEQTLLYLKGLLKYNLESKIAVVEVDTPRLESKPEFLYQLVDYFNNNSPLLQSINFGLQALDKRVELEERKKYPDVFLALGFGYGTAPGRDEQTNAFVDDDYNYEKIGGVIGAKWDFNFYTNSAKVEKSIIDYHKTLKNKEMVLITMDGKIRKAYSEAVRSQDLLDASQESLKAAKAWLLLENDNQELGIGDVRRFVKAYQTFFRLKGQEITTRYQYLLSLAQLANVAGNMDLFIQWIHNGKVQFN